MRVEPGAGPQDVVVYLQAPSVAWVQEHRLPGHYLIDIPFGLITEQTQVTLSPELYPRVTLGNMDAKSGRLLLTPSPVHVEVFLQHDWQSPDPSRLDPLENLVLQVPSQEVLAPLVELPKRSAYLTIDDGPWPGSTPAILAALEELDIPATFFLIGAHVDAYPQLAEAIAAHSFQIANHTYTHDYHRLYSSDEFFFSEVAQTQARFQQLGLRPGPIVRPPGGFPLSEALRLSLAQAGYRVIYWNMSAEDAYANQTSEQLVKRIQAQLQKFSGSDQPLIILLHDRWPYTAEALPEIVHLIREAGYQFQPLPI
ncbi:MAG: polysaccharide deacetylase family protein [Thermostichus sp. DRC_bins_24]